MARAKIRIVFLIFVVFKMNDNCLVGIFGPGNSKEGTRIEPQVYRDAGFNWKL